MFFNSYKIFDYEFNESDCSISISTLVNNSNWILVCEGIENPPTQLAVLFLLTIPAVGFSMSALLFYLFRIMAKNLRLSQSILNAEKISAMGIMISCLSHDLRNPLTVIKSNLELLMMSIESNNNEKTTKFKKRIEDSVE